MSDGLIDISGVSSFPVAPNPSAGTFYMGIDSTDGHFKIQNSAGVVTDLTMLVGDHALLSGLGDDDHTQYHNDTRGDIRYYTQAQIDAFLLAIDHNALDNYVSSQHVDHATLDVNTNANSGLAGGGNLTVDRNLSLDFNNLPAYGEPADLDNELFTPVYDSSDTTHKVLPRRFLASVNPDLYYVQADDFVGTVLGGLTNRTQGAGSSSQVGTYGLGTGENTHGITQSDTGSTTGRAYLTTSDNAMLHKNSSTSYRLRVRHAIELLSGAETFFQRIGFGVGFSAGLPADGLYFQYTDAENGGRYELISRVGAVTTQQIDTGVIADLDYHVFDIRWYMDGSASGYIDGNLIGTILAVNAPNNINLGFGFGIEKTVGTVQRNCNVDWFSFEIFRDAER